MMKKTIVRVLTAQYLDKQYKWLLAAILVLAILALSEIKAHADENGKVAGLDGLQVAEKKAEDPVKTLDVSFSSKIFSRYVGDAGVKFYNGAVSQNDLTIIHSASGVYFDLWVSTSLKDAGRKTNYGNEIDVTFGWAGEVAGFGIDAGVSYWEMLPLFNIPEGDIIQPYAEMNKKITVCKDQILTPSLRVEYGIPAKGNDVGSKGLHIHSGLKHGWELMKDLSLNQKIALTYDNGAYGSDYAWIGAYELNPSYRLTDWLAAEISVKLIGPLSDVDDGRKTEVIYGTGLTFTLP